MSAFIHTLLKCGLLFLAVACAHVTFAADESGDKPPAKPLSSLDQQLLDDLDTPLRDDLDDQPVAAPKSNPGTAAADKAGRSPLDEELLRDLGEDIGTGDSTTDDNTPGDGGADGPAKDDAGKEAATQDPLVPIGRKMRSVQSRLTEQKLDQQTFQLQENILGDLAALLQECKKQCQGGGSGKPGSKSGKSGKGSQAGTAPATDAARDSSQDLRDRPTERSDARPLAGAMQESWGNLPEHARKYLSNVNPDAFLPKYELMLEKYFKRLGEADPDGMSK